MMWSVIPLTSVSLYTESAKTLIETTALRLLVHIKNVIIKLKQIVPLIQEVIK